MEKTSSGGLVVAGLVGAAAVTLLVIRSQSDFITFNRSGFFQPEVTANLSNVFPDDTEDHYIWSTWSWVGTTIPYEAVGSDIQFIGDQVRCNKWGI